MIISELFVYKILFVIEILIAMFYFSFRLRKKKHFYLRAALVSLICIGISVVFPLFKSFSYTWWYSSIMFLILFLCILFGFMFILDVSWQKIFFIGIASYTAQHFAYQIYSLVTYIFQNNEVISDTLYSSQEVVFTITQLKVIFGCVMFVIYALVYAAIYLLFVDKINKNEVNISNTSIVSLAGLILLTDVIFNAIVVYTNVDNQLISIVICLYNIVCCLLVLYIQFSLMNTKQLRTELLVTTQLLKKSEEQYKQNKENISLINMKCHDLKHQIHNYDGMKQVSKEAKEDIEKMIDIYDSNVATGNEALDLIITEKSLLCHQQGINLKCLADCSKLNSISDSDLYSLFGNAIDNSIEAVLKITDKEKRTINLIVRNVFSFVSISIQNYYEGELKLDESGFPISTKSDQDLHGYGLKSIKFIVNKYNGNLKINIDEDVFTLGILLPMDKNNK